MDIISIALQALGPCRSSKLAEHLQKKNGISSSAARQRIARSTLAIKFPVPLLPNRESFVYLKKQSHLKTFWPKFHNILRETNSIYGMAIDGLASRGGVVRVSEFPVISGAPIALKKQVTTDIVAKNLKKAGVINTVIENGIKYYCLKEPFESEGISRYQHLLLVERILLDGIKEWARNLGLVSYNKVQTRGSKDTCKVGQFKWDLTGPSYLLPLKTPLSNKPGFLVADVFSRGILSEYNIKYFVRKVQLLQSSIKNIKFLPMLVGSGFDSSALKYGKSVGVVLASTKSLFGSEVAQGISMLIETLNNAAATAVANPQKLVEILNKLSQIEGAKGNLRGTFFELISVYLAKKGAESVDHSVKIIDPQTERQAEIDVFRVIHKSEIMCIECKGKGPDGIIEIKDVDNWLKRLPMFRNYINTQDRFKEAKVSFELWSTGTFSDESIKKLKREKKKRVNNPINWKDGNAILALARNMREQGIVQALNNHFIKHPLNN